MVYWKRTYGTELDYYSWSSFLPHQHRGSVHCTRQPQTGRGNCLAPVDVFSAHFGCGPVPVAWQPPSLQGAPGTATGDERTDQRPRGGCPADARVTGNLRPAT